MFCVGLWSVSFGATMASVRLLEAIRALPMAAVNDLRIVAANGTVETSCLLIASASPMMRSALEDPFNFNAASDGAVVAVCPDMSKEDVEAFVEALLARADTLASHDSLCLRAFDCFSVHVPDVESDLVERTEDPLGDLGEQFNLEPAAAPLSTGNSGAPTTKRSAGDAAVAPPPMRMSNCVDKKEVTKKLAPKKVSTYPCAQCDTVLATSYSLKIHFSTIHSKEKNYKCEVCGRKFAQQSHLTVHLKSHNGYKNWLCCTCGKALSSAPSLKVRKCKLPPSSAPHTALCLAEAPRESRARRPQRRGRTGKLQAQTAQGSP